MRFLSIHQLILLLQIHRGSLGDETKFASFPRDLAVLRHGGYIAPGEDDEFTTTPLGEARVMRMLDEVMH